MARRRKQLLEEGNHERWLVSYADFITLLFAFFVVMYSISSVNEGKYRVLSKTLSSVFNEDAGGVDSVNSDVINVGDPVRDIVALPDSFPLATQANKSEFEQQLNAQAHKALAVAASQQRVLDELQISLQQHMDQGMIDLRKNGDRIEIEIKAKMLFSSGKTVLSSAAMDALRDVSRSLLDIPNPVQVEGHSDNVPIRSQTYRSNWELSAARAASVVHFLSGQGIRPQRLAAVGLGEYRPIASNDTIEGRIKNRRITLLILGAEPEIFEPGQIVPWAEGPAAPNP